MVWSFLFVVSIAQGLFLISLIAVRPNQNPPAARMLTVLILLMVLTNVDFFMVSSGIYPVMPNLFGISFGLMLLFGPLLYLYTKFVVDISFSWKTKYLLHFVPYMIKLLSQFNLYTLPSDFKNNFIQMYLSGTLPVRSIDAATHVLQSLHLFVYLILSMRVVKSLKPGLGNASYMVSISSRAKWIRVLLFCFWSFLVSVVIAVIYLLVKCRYVPVANYVYTLITSATVFIISYKFALNPESVSPNFSQKYRFTRKIDADETSRLVAKLDRLIQDEKIYLRQELKLNDLAEKLGVPPHQLSKLLNEQYQKNFNEFIGGLRVQEFIARMNDEKYKGYSIYGIAMDVGFNSKSSFNNTFKKHTGKTPSEYKDAK